MQEYLDKKTLAVQLSISPKTLQKEITSAMKDGCNAVLKIGKSYRIEPKGFISYLINKNKSKEVNQECQNEQKQKDCIKERGFGILTSIRHQPIVSEKVLEQLLS